MDNKFIQKKLSRRSQPVTVEKCTPAGAKLELTHFSSTHSSEVFVAHRASINLLCLPNIVLFHFHYFSVSSEMYFRNKNWSNQSFDQSINQSNNFF